MPYGVGVTLDASFYVQEICCMYHFGVGDMLYVPFWCKRYSC